MNRRATPRGGRPRLATGLLLSLALAHVLAHLLTNGRYGMFRDEYYYLACANHLDWGFVDHPPLSVLVLAGWRALFGATVESIRVPAALAGGAAVWLAGLLAREMGGRRLAQGLAALAAWIMPVLIVVTGYYSMNVFEPLIWLGAALLLLRIQRDDARRLWPWLGLLLGLGLLNKIGVLVLGASIAVGVLVTPLRRHLAERRLWLGVGLTLLLFLPFLLWQLGQGWPTLEFIANAKENKIATLAPVAFLGETVLESHPASLPLLITGILWLLLSRAARPFRALGWIWPVACTILILQRSKPYYLSPAHPIVLTAGAVAVGEFLRRRRWRWGGPVLVVHLTLGGLFTLPMCLPLFSPEFTSRYMVATHLQPETGETAHSGLPLPQYFSDRFGWREQAEAAAAAYAAMPPEERSDCVLLCDNYGSAGAADYFRARGLDLPPTVCWHNSYWYWRPEERSGAVALAIGIHPELLARYYDEVEVVATVDAPHALPWVGQATIWRCRGAKADLASVWPLLRNFI